MAPNKIPNKTVHIIGKGAIGLLFAAFLAKKYRVVLIVRDHATNTQQAKCLGLTQRTFAITCKTMQEIDEIDFLIVPTKAYQVLDAFKAVQKKLSTQAMVVLSHNGMGTTELIQPLLTEKQGLFFLATNMGAYKISDFEVKHTGNGDSMLGAINTSAKAYIDVITKKAFSQFPLLSKTNDLPMLQWQKLLINIAINPLSAIHQVKNGELGQPQYSLKILNLLNEAVQVANAEGVSISLHQALTKAYHVITQTAHNHSSMNRDVHFKRQTEISAITGYVIKKGAEHHIQTPFNKALYQQLSEDDTPSH